MPLTLEEIEEMIVRLNTKAHELLDAAERLQQQAERLANERDQLEVIAMQLRGQL